VLRYFAGNPAEDRLLIVNMGADLHLSPAPEPLIAPYEDTEWEMVWSSEDPRYGGVGTPPVAAEGGSWKIPGYAAVVLQLKPAETDLDTDEQDKAGP
jgi:maltooligosyltrehalose trehalohydrolase